MHVVDICLYERHYIYFLYLNLKCTNRPLVITLIISYVFAMKDMRSDT